MSVEVTSPSYTWWRFSQRFVPVTFLAPAAIIFAVYVIYPIIDSIWLSFHWWDGLGEKEFIGFENYQRLVTEDHFFLAIKNNILWLLFFMLSPIFGLALALFLNQEVFGIRLVKSLFFFPFVISLAVIGLVFGWFYEPVNGLFNTILALFGIQGPAILSDTELVTYGVIAAGMWPQIAYCMILYLTGLNSVNPELIEAGRIDGAKGARMLWHIVLPQLRPATFIAVVISIIGALRSFDIIAIMTKGGPYNHSSVLAWYMYEQAMFNYSMGYGAAIATVLFLIMDVFIIGFLWWLIKQEREEG
ncbi:MAG: sugar ABC transporter permease [Pseudomonadota bacterium]